MTGWSTAALLLLGVIAGPYCLDLLSRQVVLLLDPVIAMSLGMLGVFVGLSFDLRQAGISQVLAASTIRIVTVITAVAAGALGALSYWPVGAVLPIWLPALMAGVCAAAAKAPADVAVDDALVIVAGSAIIAAVGARQDAPIVLAVALAGVSVLVAFAGWLLVGQTDLEGEQHVFVVGSLLLLGGAATYLSLSALAAGLVAGIVWNLAGNVAKPRIIRDLNYFQHPLVVLLMVAAGAGATLSTNAMVLAIVFVAAGALARPAGAWAARRLTDVRSTGERGASLISAGFVGIALALDAFRGAAAGEWAGPLLGAVAVGTIVSDSISLLVPVRREAR